ncbi:MAG: hypothetical protein JNJ77_08995 [Planctomycetia bacterium]|nr:hypothetical protein [Planctomycetia bacterium]
MNKTSFVRKILTTALVLVALLPVPALAITFLGGWQFFATHPGITSQTFTDDFNNYGLTISMGAVAAPSGVTKVSVTAIRDFRVTDPSELVRISHSFGSYIQDGSINVNVSIQRYGVANDPFNFPPYSFITQNPALQYNPSLNDFFKQNTLAAATYRMAVTITYTRSGATTSSWNNSSPHVFNFRGV